MSRDNTIKPFDQIAADVVVLASRLAAAANHNPEIIKRVARLAELECAAHPAGWSTPCVYGDDVFSTPAPARKLPISKRSKSERVKLRGWADVWASKVFLLGVAYFIGFVLSTVGVPFSYGLIPFASAFTFFAVYYLVLCQLTEPE